MCVCVCVCVKIKLKTIVYAINMFNNFHYYFHMHMYLQFINYFPIFLNCTDRKRRGTSAGIRKKQERFMKFLLHLSSVHYCRSRLRGNQQRKK